MINDDYGKIYISYDWTYEGVVFECLVGGIAFAIWVTALGIK
jgi:hypothetical protein